MGKSELITLPKTRFLYVCAVVLALVVLALAVAGFQDLARRTAPEADPDACFPEEAGLDPFLVDWYCGHLRAAGLAHLSGDPAFRFTYLPTFDAPRVATAFLDDGRPVIEGIVLSGLGGYEPGEVAIRTKRVLSKQEWSLLNQRVDNAGLWDPVSKEETLGADGSRWVLEGRLGGSYRLHDPWSPSAAQLPQFIEACMYMLELASILPERQEFLDYGLER